MHRYFSTEEPVTYFSFTEVKNALRTEVDSCLWSLPLFVLRPLTMMKKKPVGISSATPPPSQYYDLASRLTHVPSVGVYDNIQPSNVFSLPLLAEIFTLDGVWEVTRGVLRIRTLHPRSQ